MPKPVGQHLGAGGDKGGALGGGRGAAVAGTPPCIRLAGLRAGRTGCGCGSSLAWRRPVLHGLPSLPRADTRGRLSKAAPWPPCSTIAAAALRSLVAVGLREAPAVLGFTTGGLVGDKLSERVAPAWLHDEGDGGQERLRVGQVHVDQLHGGATVGGRLGDSTLVVPGCTCRRNTRQARHAAVCCALATSMRGQVCGLNAGWSSACMHTGSMIPGRLA